MLSKGTVNLMFSTLVTLWSKYINSNFDNQRYLAYSMISSKSQLFLCIHIIMYIAWRQDCTLTYAKVQEKPFTYATVPNL